MRKTNFEIRKVELIAAVSEPFSVLYLSDFHFNRFSGKVAQWMTEKVAALNPDIVLLGGDYVDMRSGLVHFDYFLKSIAHRQHVYAVAGNHDYFFGIDKIKNSLEKQEISWLENKSTTIQLGKIQVQIDGNKLQKRTTKSDFAILCVHNPSVLNGNLNPYDLAFAGHLHASQFVFWKHAKGLYPGRLFYKWNVLQREKENCNCLISKGLGDTLPLRFNCKKDMILVEVKSA